MAKLGGVRALFGSRRSLGVCSVFVRVEGRSGGGGCGWGLGWAVSQMLGDDDVGRRERPRPLPHGKCDSLLIVTPALTTCRPQTIFLAHVAYVGRRAAHD